MIWILIVLFLQIFYNCFEAWLLSTLIVASPDLQHKRALHCILLILFQTGVVFQVHFAFFLMGTESMWRCNYLLLRACLYLIYFSETHTLLSFLILPFLATTPWTIIFIYVQVLGNATIKYITTSFDYRNFV